MNGPSNPLQPTSKHYEIFDLPVNSQANGQSNPIQPPFKHNETCDLPVNSQANAQKVSK